MRRVIAVGVALLVSLAGALPAGAETEEGIQVHGHWKIEILEPDGTLVSVMEFENALVDPSAWSYLAKLLSAVASSGGYLVYLENDPGVGPCNDDLSDPISCHIAEAGSLWPVSPHSSNLLITATGTTVVLAGSVTADNSEPVSVVGTRGKVCTVSYSPLVCRGESMALVEDFTRATLPSPVPIDAGQIIQVTVTISFS